MKSLTFSKRSVVVGSLFIIALALFQRFAHGATCTWNGGGGANGNWTNAANWDKVPVAGDALAFTTVAGIPTNPHNDFPVDTPFGPITFTGTIAYTLYGNQIVLAGGITHNTDPFTSSLISLPISLSSTQAITVNGTTSLLNLNGVITGSAGAGLTISGTGSLKLAGGAANTYMGITTVTSGTLILEATAVSIPGPIAITGGAVQLTQPNQIADSASVTVTGAGRLQLQGRSETVGSVAGDGFIDLGGFNSSPFALTVGGNNASTLFSGPISGNDATGSLVKLGTGTLTLSGTSTFPGSTTVGAGTLAVSGKLPGPISVSATGTLGGAGSVGPITATGGAISPGAGGAGTLSVAGSASLDASSSYIVALNGTAAGAFGQASIVGGTPSLGGAALSASIGYFPTAGDTFVILANDGADPISGTFKNLPEGATVLADPWRLRISYSGGDGNDVALTVLPNHPPVASSGTLSVGKNKTASGILAATDQDGNSLTYAIVANGTLGTATVTNAATGAFTYVPNANATGTDAFTFKAIDGIADSNVATISVTISPSANNAPVASNLSISSAAGATFFGTLAATDANSDPLTYSIVSNGTLGTAAVTNAATGAFTYVPKAGASGADSFTFKANDGIADSNVATVSVTVTSNSLAKVPFVTSPLSAQATAGTPFSYQITATNSPTSFSTLSLPAGLSLNTLTGLISGTPSAAGTAAVSLIAANSFGSGLSTLTLTVSAPVGGAGTAPAIPGPLAASAVQGQSFAFPISASGTAPIAYSASPLPPGVSISGNVIAGAPSVAGRTAITLTASNAAGAASQTLVLTIAPPPGVSLPAPSLASFPPFAQPSLAGTALSFTAAASSAAGALLLYSWDFGDGTGAYGNPVSHTYAAPGIYVTTLSVSDGANAVTETVEVPVNAIAPAGSLSISRAQAKFSFMAPGADILTLSGTVPLPSGVSTLGKNVRVLAQNLTIAFTLDAKGKSLLGKSSFSLTGKTALAKFQATVKGTLFKSLSGAGFPSGSVPKPGVGVNLSIIISIDNESYAASVPMQYTATAGKTGIGRK